MSSGHMVQGVLRLWLCVLHAIVKVICPLGDVPLAICSPRDELWLCGSRRIEHPALCSPRDELWPCGSRRIGPLVICSLRDCQSHMLTGNECRGNSTRTSKCHEEHISKAAASQISLLCILWYLSYYAWNMHKNMNTFSLLNNSLFATLLI